jgi:hypothetical protein
MISRDVFQQPFLSQIFLSLLQVTQRDASRFKSL